MINVLKKSLVSVLQKFDRQLVRKSEQKCMSNFLQNAKNNGLAPNTVIDVGVAYGTAPLYQAFRNAHHFLIEPIAEWEPSLQRICQEYKGEYVIAAAGKINDKIEINVHNKLSSSSILFETDVNTDGKCRSVPIIRIDDQCALRKLAAPYVLKIDVQGFELDVLDGCTAILPSCELIMLEASLFRFYKDGPDFYDIIVAMKKMGFVLYDMFDWHNRPLDNALAQIDLAFVPENGSLRNTHNYATSEQRKWEIEATESMLK